MPPPFAGIRIEPVPLTAAIKPLDAIHKSFVESGLLTNNVKRALLVETNVCATPPTVIVPEWSRGDPEINDKHLLKYL
jgi:hypothetical protein